MNLIGEPIIDDDRFEKAERIVRQRVPSLPEDTVFMSYVQEPTEARVDGLLRFIPPTAVFLAKTPNPRNKQFDIIDRGAETLAVWRARDRAYRHYSGMEDPLIPHLTQIAREHVRKLDNLRAMI